MTTQSKPKCKLTGTDSNVFALMAKVRRTLLKAGLHDQAKACMEEIMKAENYHEALAIMTKYVDVS